MQSSLWEGGVTSRAALRQWPSSVVSLGPEGHPACSLGLLHGTHSSVEPCWGQGGGTPWGGEAGGIPEAACGPLPHRLCGQATVWCPRLPSGASLVATVVATVPGVPRQAVRPKQLRQGQACLDVCFLQLPPVAEEQPAQQSAAWRVPRATPRPADTEHPFFPRVGGTEGTLCAGGFPRARASACWAPVATSQVRATHGVRATAWGQLDRVPRVTVSAESEWGQVQAPRLASVWSQEGSQWHSETLPPCSVLPGTHLGLLALWIALPGGAWSQLGDLSCPEAKVPTGFPCTHVAPPALGVHSPSASHSLQLAWTVPPGSPLPLHPSLSCWTQSAALTICIPSLSPDGLEAGGGQ